VLRNEQYIGIWPWGRRPNVRNPLTGQITQEERSHLRLIEDEQFFKVQALLDELEAAWDRNRKADGTFTGSRVGSSQSRHLLQG
jgi:hypothetical protein